MFDSRVVSAKCLNLLYDDVERHYHVITNLTGAMASRYVWKRVRKVVWLTWRTFAIRRVATAWRVRLVHLKVFETPGRNAMDTLEVRSVSKITRDVQRRKEPRARVSVVAACVEQLWRAKITNVINGFVKTVTRTKKQVTCVTWDRWRKCCQPAIGCCTYFTILRPLRTRDIRMWPRYTFPIPSAYNNSVWVVRTRNILRQIACNVARESTRSGMIP